MRYLCKVLRLLFFPTERGEIDFFFSSTVIIQRRYFQCSLYSHTLCLRGTQTKGHQFAHQMKDPLSSAAVSVLEDCYF